MNQFDRVGTQRLGQIDAMNVRTESTCYALEPDHPHPPSPRRKGRPNVRLLAISGDSANDIANSYPGDLLQYAKNYALH